MRKMMQKLTQIKTRKLNRMSTTNQQMYFSEFTLKLIEEVKKREILYNTKYERRPKSEKEGAWKQIAEELDTDSEKCKKHWKNVRDRFVKVMHQRDKHFANGGTELNAPQYIYFDKLNFMRQFSIQKDLQVEVTSNIPVSTTISPFFLLFEEYKESSGATVLLDFTEKFLQSIKGFPILYDQHAELRKYRSKESWKQLADLLGGKFTVGRLRSYWMTLMKKYKMYLENAHNNCEPIENEALFESLSFVNIGVKIKDENVNDILYIVQSDEMDSSQEYFEELDEEEHLLCEEIEHETPVEQESHSQEDETAHAVEAIKEPAAKKIKFDNNQQKLKANPEVKIIERPQQQETPIPAATPQPSTEDEYDYFGKKVALQLRDLAQKNRSLARKGEIKVLQLLMELEESLEN